MATAIACLHRMHWTTFPRINAGLRRSDEPWLLLAVALVFAGEIILNVMLCVFPVLFLKALALVGGAGESKTRQQAHGMAYSAGILCSFWIIAGALLTLRALGKQAVWGFQLQSRGFVAL
jgi:thiol:disulfide interchange protein